MDEELQLDPKDLSREYPAVRCRDCGAITHVCTANGSFEEYSCHKCRRLGRACHHTARRVRTRDTEYHLDDGWKLATSNHRKGCSKPPSRLPLLMMLQDQALDLKGFELETRLMHYMTEREVKRATTELLEYLHDR